MSRENLPRGWKEWRCPKCGSMAIMEPGRLKGRPAGSGLGLECQACCYKGSIADFRAQAVSRTWQSDPVDLQNRLCNQITRLRAEVERLRAAIDEIADNKTNSRTWLEAKARAAREPKP